MRFARILHLIHELYALVHSIIAAMKTFLWTVLLLFMLIFLFGVCITQIVADARRDSQEHRFKHWAALDRFYGNLPFSVLTLFQAMSGGVDWDDACRPLMEDISPLMALIFCFYMSLSIFIMMNLVTGVFVTCAWFNLEESKQERLVNNIRQLFLSGDRDHTGSISWEEFRGQLQNPLMEEFFKQIDLDPAQAKDFYDWLDITGQGEVNLDDFVMGCLRMFGSAKSLDLAMLMELSKKTHERIEETERSVHSMSQSLNVLQNGRAFESMQMQVSSVVGDKRWTNCSQKHPDFLNHQSDYAHQMWPALQDEKAAESDDENDEMQAPSPVKVPPPGFSLPSCLPASPTLQGAPTVSSGEYFKLDATKVHFSKDHVSSFREPGYLFNATPLSTQSARDYVGGSKHSSEVSSRHDLAQTSRGWYAEPAD